MSADRVCELALPTLTGHCVVQEPRAQLGDQLEDRCLDGRGAAMPWQERGMEVQEAPLRQPEDLGRDEPAVVRQESFCRSVRKG